MPWLREQRVDHVHAHFGTNSAEVAMLANVLGGPPWSFTVHGPEEFDKAHRLWSCGEDQTRRIRGRGQLLWPEPTLSACRSGALAESSCRSLRPGCGLSGGPQLRLIGPAPPVCVGRLCEQKGQLLLIEAAQRLMQPEQTFELVLAGDGELRADIEALIARYKLQTKVRITGWISGERVREEILAARALVLPSFAEGLPVVLMEAMALRRPVISTYVAGIPELVTPGEHGWLVPAGDVPALVKAMRACLEASIENLTMMGEAASQRVLARHSAAVQSAHSLQYLARSLHSRLFIWSMRLTENADLRCEAFCFNL